MYLHMIKKDAIRTIHISDVITHDITFILHSFKLGYYQDNLMWKNAHQLTPLGT